VTHAININEISLAFGSLKTIP